MEEVPPELQGAFSCLWASDLKPEIEVEILRKMQQEDAWPDGSTKIEEMILSVDQRKAFFYLCWQKETEDATEGEAVHNQKRARVLEI